MIKNEEQIRSKLSECKRQLEFWEDINERESEPKTLKYVHMFRGKVEMLRWMLNTK